jgi:glycosyltransferase involved in cell wall biosynthesis
MSLSITPAASCPSTRLSSRQLHVVMIDEELPYPPVSGKRIRTLNLTQRLAEQHRITYVCHRNADADEAHVAADHFDKLGIRTVVIDRPVPPRRGIGFYARLAANLFSPLPYSVSSHTSRPMCEALASLARTEAVDLWHVEWTPYAQALGGIPGHRLVMAHNVESVIWQRYHETETNPLKRWYIGGQWRKYLSFEQQALQSADLTVAVSELDADRFRRGMGVSCVDVVDNGVDTSYFHPTDTPREPATLLFLGSLDWRPNLDGVQQLLDSVFPAVRREVPEARLLLVGRNPPGWLQRTAASTPGVELHGNVPDVRPFLARAGMLVVPLRIGGGSRLKILEALACGTPVVSTRVGAEGLALVPAQHLEISQSMDDLPASIVVLIRDPQRAARQAEAGRAQVLRRYDWDRLAERLEQLWLGCAAGAAQGAPNGRGIPR